VGAEGNDQALEFGNAAAQGPGVPPSKGDHCLLGIGLLSQASQRLQVLPGTDRLQPRSQQLGVALGLALGQVLGALDSQVVGTGQQLPHPLHLPTQDLIHGFAIQFDEMKSVEECLVGKRAGRFPRGGGG